MTHMDRPSDHANRLWKALNAYDEGVADGFEAGQHIRAHWAITLFVLGVAAGFIVSFLVSLVAS